MSSDKEILALEDKRYTAMCGGDFATLEAMLHDELLYTHCPSSKILRHRAAQIKGGSGSFC